MRRSITPGKTRTAPAPAAMITAMTMDNLLGFGCTATGNTHGLNSRTFTGLRVYARHTRDGMADRRHQ
jgi:hypothetical protein